MKFLNTLICIERLVRNVDNFSYFHLCDHQIQRVQNKGTVMIFPIESNNEPIQVLVNGGAVIRIQEVRVLEYDAVTEIVDGYYDNIDNEQTYDDKDPGEVYYDDKKRFVVDYSKYFQEGEKLSNPLPNDFYSPILHNRIEWLVRPPKKYQVTAEVRFLHSGYQTYRAAECPICGGLGWFIDILNKNGQFQQPKGIEKIAQRVVKGFLTEVGTQMFDDSYGTTVKKDAMRLSSNDDSLFNEIRIAISNVEDEYLNDQQNIITQLSSDEILLSLSAENVFRSTQNPTTVFIHLKIETSEDEKIFQLGFGS